MPTAPAAGHNGSHSILSPQGLFSHSGRAEVLGLHQTAPASLPVSNHSASQYGNHSNGSILPGSQMKALWPPTLSALPLGSGPPLTDKAGTTGSAFSAWAPSQGPTGHSLLSVQSMQAKPTSHADLRSPVAPATGPLTAMAPLAGAEPGLAHPDLPQSQFTFPTVPSQLSQMVPSTPQQAPALPTSPGLAYSPLSLGFPMPGLALPAQLRSQFTVQLPGQLPAQLPSSPISRAPVAAASAGFSALNYGMGSPMMLGMLPQIPTLPGMQNVPSQWPLNLNPGAASQPLPFPPFGYSMSPYPLGFGHLPPQPLPPFQPPSDPQTASSTASVRVPGPPQGLSHLPASLAYHLPPYPPNALQTLIASQPPPLGPPHSVLPEANPQVKQESGSLGSSLPEQIGSASQLRSQHGQTSQQAAGLHSNGNTHMSAKSNRDDSPAANLAQLSRASSGRSAQKPAGPICLHCASVPLLQSSACACAALTADCKHPQHTARCTDARTAPGCTWLYWLHTAFASQEGRHGKCLDTMDACWPC